MLGTRADPTMRVSFGKQAVNLEPLLRGGLRLDGMAHGIIFMTSIGHSDYGCVLRYMQALALRTVIVIRHWR